jgi:hypothetical protein
MRGFLSSRITRCKPVFEIYAVKSEKGEPYLSSLRGKDSSSSSSSSTKNGTEISEDRETR